MNNSKSYVNWGNLVVGIIFILASLISFINPTSNLIAVVIVFAISAIIDGLYQLLIRRRIKEAIGYRSNIMIVIGIIDIVVGIILIMNIGKSIVALSYLFALWFILRSLEGLLTSGLAKYISREYYWLKIILSIFGIVIGILLFKNPLSSQLTISFLIGANFMFIGILNMIEAFSGK